MKENGSGTLFLDMGAFNILSIVIGIRINPCFLV
jgi:hypothetical protein